MIPEGIDVRWVKTDFDGMMPRRWESSAVSNTTGVWPRPETRVVRDGRFNGMNKASVEPGTFVSLALLRHWFQLMRRYQWNSATT
jgi:alpha-1,2-mannosyltransferase